MGRLLDGTKSGGDVTEAAPQAPLVEVVEVEVPVELGGLLIDGVDDNGPSAELAPAAYATAQGVDQEMTAQTLALFVTVDRQAGQQDNGHRVGHPPPQSRWRPAVSDGAQCQRFKKDGGKWHLPNGKPFTLTIASISMLSPRRTC